MKSETVESGWNHREAPVGSPVDLPPVEPPSAGLVVQLFIIPLVIVGVLVVGGLLVYLPFGRLAGGEQTAVEYVRTIRDNNVSRQRFRAAFELATLIQNDASLAKNSNLLGEIVKVLKSELVKKDETQVTSYLALMLGAFETLDAGDAGDPLEVLARCLDADQPTVVRSAAAESLARQGARLDGKLDASKVIAPLVAAARSDDVELRLRAVYALGFLGGEEAEKALVEHLKDEDRFVGYNAATALARRDNSQALDLLREMLDDKALRQVIPLKDEAEIQRKIETIELDVLKSLEFAIGQGKVELADLLHPQIKLLTRSRLAAVRNAAENIMKLRSK